MRIPMKAVVVLLLLAVVLTAAACDDNNPDDQQQRKQSIQTRTEVFGEAEAKYPLPHPKNFPLRQALVEFTLREDLLDHPWYVYIIADTGNILGYYVAKQVPVNSCTFLSSTENVFTEGIEGTVVLTAPSLDGIYYGGGGASAGCDEWFFFDGATNAMIKIRGVKFFVADQPLKLQAEPIVVQQ